MLLLKVRLFLTQLDRLAENPVILSDRVVTIPEMPHIGQHLLVALPVMGTVPAVVSSTYLQVEGGKEVAAHVFATITIIAPEEAKRVGVSQDHAGYASMDTFDGRTIGELLAFLGQFPHDMEVMFQDQAVLVSKSKGATIILRLDDKEDHT